MEYRYMVWNNIHKCFQFPSVCETTEKGAKTILFKKIGYDSYKYRFEIKKVEKEKAYEIRQNLKDEIKARRIGSELENIPFEEILVLVVRNRTQKRKILIGEEEKC